MGTFEDFLGNRIAESELTDPRAEGRIGTIRDPYSGHPADGITPQRLANILRSAATGNPERYFELAEDIEERDLHYAAVMATRKRSVSQLPITVTAASDSPEHKKHAELVQAWVDDEILRASLFDMLDAIGKGMSVLEVDWQPRLGKTLPRELTYRSPRWFSFDQQDGETIELREGTGSVPLPAHKFVTHRHKTKSGLTIRSGIARVACWAWMFKAFTVKDWAIFSQNFGQPIRLGKYGRGATEAEKDIVWRAIHNIAGDCAALVPVGMGIEFVEVAAKGTSTDLFERRVDWMDRQISKLVLGQTTTTDAVSGGHAVSQEHRLVQEDIERSDALSVSATINAQLIPNIIAFNFGPQDHYPKVRIGRPDEVPLKEFSEAFDKFARHGLTAKAAEVRGRLGLSAPEKDDEIIGGRQTPAVTARDSQTPGDTQTARQALDRLFTSTHSAQQQDPVDVLTARLERDAAGAMNGMIDEVRQVLMHATDLRDAAERLSRLDLSADELTEAMARGMALAHLAGQASLIDSIKGQSK